MSFAMFALAFLSDATKWYVEALACLKYRVVLGKQYVNKLVSSLRVYSPEVKKNLGPAQLNQGCPTFFFVGPNEEFVKRSRARLSISQLMKQKNQAVSYAHADQLSPWIGDLEQT